MKIKKGTIVLETNNQDLRSDKAFIVTIHDQYWTRNYTFFNDELDNLLYCYSNIKKSPRKKSNKTFSIIKKFFKDLGF